MKATFFLKNSSPTGLTIESKELGADEERVLDLLRQYGKVRIGQLVRVADGMGAHDLHETARKKTTTRKMFQIIRNLRDAGCPIVGDVKGLWIARTVWEIEQFADHLEQKARSDIASMLSLRTSMLDLISSRTPSLFDPIMAEADKV